MKFGYRPTMKNHIIKCHSDEKIISDTSNSDNKSENESTKSIGSTNLISDSDSKNEGDESEEFSLTQEVDFADAD